MEMRSPNAAKINTPAMVDRAESASLLVRSYSATEIDGARRNRGQQTQVYDLHKGIAESAMDISLLTANANQLRLLITYNNRSKTYIACITLVIISLVLQVLVASGVIIIRVRCMFISMLIKKKTKTLSFPESTKSETQCPDRTAKNRHLYRSVNHNGYQHSRGVFSGHRRIKFFKCTLASNPHDLLVIH